MQDVLLAACEYEPAGQVVHVAVEKRMNNDTLVYTTNYVHALDWYVPAAQSWQAMDPPVLIVPVYLRLEQLRKY